MPAVISPITGGWPILRKTAPNSRAAMMITIIWRSRVPNGLLMAPRKIFPGQVSEVSVDGDVLTGAMFEADWPAVPVTK